MCIIKQTMTMRRGIMMDSFKPICSNIFQIYTTESYLNLIWEVKYSVRNCQEKQTKEYSSKSVMPWENMWWSLGSVGTCRSLTESAWLMRNWQSFCYRIGKFLFLKEEATLVLLMLTFMTLALYQPQIWIEVQKTHAAGGGYFSKSKL
jgi:hypothetical protein